MALRKLSLLIENFHALLAAAGGDGRHPALEAALTRSDRLHAPHSRFDAIRFSLCGFQTGSALPIAAVTRLADGPGEPDSESWWLRADPVTMQADISRVFMTGSGTRDLAGQERRDLALAVQSLLRDEDLELDAAHPDRWYLALPEPIPFDFTPLDEALGVDIAEVFPEHPEALAWRRLMNEVQMALYAHPVNEARRERGRPEINSLWFWGGGYRPERPDTDALDQVYSGHEVSRGLARLAGIEPLEIGGDEIRPGGFSTLIDWPLEMSDPAAGLAQIDQLIGRLSGQVGKGEILLEVHAGAGPGRIASWRLDRSGMRRFWRRPRALQRLLDER